MVSFLGSSIQGLLRFGGFSTLTANLRDDV